MLRTTDSQPSRRSPQPTGALPAPGQPSPLVSAAAAAVLLLGLGACQSPTGGQGAQQEVKTNHKPVVVSDPHATADEPQLFAPAIGGSGLALARNQSTWSVVRYEGLATADQPVVTTVAQLPGLPQPRKVGATVSADGSEALCIASTTDLWVYSPAALVVLTAIAPPPEAILDLATTDQRAVAVARQSNQIVLRTIDLATGSHQAMAIQGQLPSTLGQFLLSDQELALTDQSGVLYTVHNATVARPFATSNTRILGRVGDRIYVATSNRSVHWIAQGAATMVWQPPSGYSGQAIGVCEANGLANLLTWSSSDLRLWTMGPTQFQLQHTWNLTSPIGSNPRGFVSLPNNWLGFVAGDHDFWGIRVGTTNIHAHVPLGIAANARVAALTPVGPGAVFAAQRANETRWSTWWWWKPAP